MVEDVVGFEIWVWLFCPMIEDSVKLLGWDDLQHLGLWVVCKGQQLKFRSHLWCGLRGTSCLGNSGLLRAPGLGDTGDGGDAGSYREVVWITQPWCRAFDGVSSLSARTKGGKRLAEEEEEAVEVEVEVVEEEAVEVEVEVEVDEVEVMEVVVVVVEEEMAAVDEEVEVVDEMDEMDEEVVAAVDEEVEVVHEDAIAGKCNVICISRDSRNPQPLEQELEMADYIFYRTFDVKHHTISDRMDDKVAGLEVKFIFNRKESKQTSNVPKMDSDKKAEAVACNQTLPLSGENPTVEFKAARTDGIANDLMETGSEDVKGLLVEQKFLPGGKPVSSVALDSDAVATTSGQQGIVPGVKTDSNKREPEKSKLRDCRVVVKDKAKFTNDSDTSDRKPAKKSMAGMKALGTTSAPSERKLKLGFGKDILESDKGVKSGIDADALEDRPSKKPRIDSSVKPEKKKNDGVQKLSINSDRNNADLAVTLTVGGKTKPEATFLGPDKDRKQRTDEKMIKFSNGKLLKVSAQDSPSEDIKTEGDGFEVTRRPDALAVGWIGGELWAVVEGSVGVDMVVNGGHP
ncbi:hypothetical protein Acr_00g0039550 [Actinidia rufa]|uniref:Uncharacterized protein n=1 Tax=Actinidia rufa TaxID=165716 RepID=A0A7J0DJB9_9ERIC|nr:hypothetical protein Acr_00g0039550 [Actinidia rufa]